MKVGIIGEISRRKDGSIWVNIEVKLDDEEVKVILRELLPK